MIKRVLNYIFRICMLPWLAWRMATTNASGQSDEGYILAEVEAILGEV